MTAFGNLEFDDSPSPTLHRVRWTVAFTDVETRGGWVRRALGYLRPGFRHCLAFRSVGEGLLLVNTTVARLQVDWFPGVTAEQYAEELKASGATVVEMSVVADDAVWTPRLLTCVSVVRALAGRRPKVQTPYRLFNELRLRRF